MTDSMNVNMNGEDMDIINDGPMEVLLPKDEGFLYDQG